jgi:hypothetical protein
MAVAFLLQFDSRHFDWPIFRRILPSVCNNESLSSTVSSFICHFMIILFYFFIDRIFRWENNIKMDLQEVGGGRGDWTVLAHDTDRWRALVGTVRDFRVP